MSSVSLFIPFAFVTHTAEFIKNVIENKARLGKVAQVDVVTKMNSTKNKYNIAYVYFDRWNDDEPTKKFLADLKSSNKPVIRFEKDFGNSMCPTYWKVFENILVEQRKKTFIPLESQEEFPVLGTPPSKVTFTNVHPQAPPRPPRKKVQVSSSVRNSLVRELNMRESSLSSCATNLDNELSSIDEENIKELYESMDLVDSGYVVRLEEENRRLREENDRIIRSYNSQVYMMDKENEHLRRIINDMY